MDKKKEYAANISREALPSSGGMLILGRRGKIFAHS